jgi:hypothetical protein
MTLDADAERDGEVECLFVGEAELACELMDPDLACHCVVFSLSSLAALRPDSLARCSAIDRERHLEVAHRCRFDMRSQCAGEGPPGFRLT